MNDEAFEALKKHLETFSDYWRDCLGLRWWRIIYIWDRDGSATQEQHPRREDGSTTAAFVDAKWQYLKASITYNMPELLALETDEERERIVLHEHCHLLVQELRPIHEDQITQEFFHHEERVVTTLTCAFWWTQLRGRKDEKQRQKAKKAAAQEMKA